MKKVEFKIYDKDGNYITTWNDVVGDLRFEVFVNGGFGELNLMLARSTQDFGEEEDVKFLNQLDVTVFDNDNTSGVKVYSGYITRYVPVLTESSEHIQVTFVGFHAELNRFIYESGGNTQITHLSKDPGKIAEDIIDKLKILGSNIDWDENTLQKTGDVVSYTFNVNTGLEAVQKMLELAPANWYWYVDADKKFHLHPKGGFANHTFTIGKEIASIEPQKRIEKVVNRIYFTGGKPEGSEFPIYKRYDDEPSQSNYGVHSIKKIDERITVSGTMDTIAENILSELKEPEIRTKISVVDNSIDNNGYDIDSIKVGDTCQIRNYQDVESSSKWDIMNWDEGFWDFNIRNITETIMHIVKISYINAQKVELEISTKLPSVSRRIEDINRNLETKQLEDNPSSPA